MKKEPDNKELLQIIKQVKGNLSQFTENLVSNFFELSVELHCIAGIDGYFKLVNPAFEKTLGYSKEELTEQPFLYFVHEDDQKSTQKVLNELSLGLPIIDFENRYRCKDGTYKWVLWTSMPFPSEEVVYAVGRDITENKRASEKLKKSYYYIDSIFRAAPIGIGLVKERILKEVNNKLCHMTGYCPEELIEQSSRILYLCDEDYNYVGQEKYRQIQEVGTGTVETRWKCKDGHTIDVLLSSTPLDVDDLTKGVTFTALDISKQNNAKLSLQKSQEKYHDLYEHAPDMYLSVDVHSSHIVECNQTLLNTLGFSKDEVIGHSVFDFYTPISAAYAKKNILPVIKEIGYVLGEQLQVQKKDGSIVDVSLNISSICDEQGNIIRSRSVWHDISEIKCLEKKLQKTLDQHRNFFEQAPQPYQSLDEEGYLLEANAAWRNTLGYNKEELSNKWFGDLLAPGFKEHFGENFPKFKSTGEVHGIEFKMLHKEGHTVDVTFDGRIVNDEQGNFQQTHCLLTDITEQNRINAQLKLFRKQIDQSKDAFFVVDYMTAQLLDVNESACQMLGYSREKLLEKSVPDISLFFDSMDKWHEVALMEKSNPDGETVEDLLIHQNGQKIPVEVSTIFQVSRGRDIFVSSVRDISERKIKEQQLEEKNQFTQSVMDGIHESVMVIESDYRVSMMNEKARALIDERYIKDINAPKCYEISHHQEMPCHGADHPCPLTQVLQDGKALSVIHQHEVRIDKVAHVELNATPLKDSHGKTYAIIESVHDITSLLQIQQELQERSIELDHQAHHDGLTNLPNRILFLDRLKQAIKQAQRNQYKIAVLFIDLDRFKEINDSFGHSIGDEVLKEISIRLQSCIRDADTVARLGGDEFTIFIDAINDNNMAIDIALDIIDKVANVISVAEQQIYVTCSIGISLYPDDGNTAAVLLRNSDSAMYKSKKEGRNTYQYYTEDMTEKAFEHILLEQNLRHAMTNNELVVYYQPQVNAQTHKIIGMEALVRWNHPDLGLISPAKFIPLAENTGLIVPLGIEVLKIATKQMGKWMKNQGGDYHLAINLSVKQLMQNNIVEFITNIVEENECQPEWIELEVTEGYLMANPEQAIKTLNQLKQKGFSLSVDDFGTGYSSLSYLKRLPIDKLKIDQSFVRDIAINEDDKAIVIAIISLAKSMGLKVIAEGVETMAQKDFLQEQKCESIQGYLYSRPVIAEKMTKFLVSKTIEL
ncbi:MAG: PAS domain S-box protein [Gammaproteobacteria bacterium]|nr:PAS domain S-box protein [Gammaproteobacteria bacterium]